MKELSEGDVQILNYLTTKTKTPWNVVASDIVKVDGTLQVEAFVCEFRGRVFVRREDLITFKSPESLLISRFRKAQEKLIHEMNKIVDKLKS